MNVFKSFLGVRHEYMELNGNLHAEYERGQAEMLTVNPKLFWGIVNRRRGTSGVPRTTRYGDKTANNDKETAELFADFFQSVFTNGTSTVNLPVGPSPARLSNICLTEDDVLKGLLSLDINKGAGPDLIPNTFLKSLAPHLCSPLLTIFNSSLSSGKFPSSWKSSFVTPIFKSGSRSDVCNYRGVVIQSAIPKLMEKLICNKIEVTVADLIHPAQHGFEKGRSTCTNLALYVSSILDNMQNGGQVDAVYTDFAKAFDRVNHQILLRKLELYGVDGNLIKWLGSYLHGRSQRIRLQSCTSREFYVGSGVPQGSHLGPLLFTIFINDLCHQLKSSRFLLYADDLKLYQRIDSRDDMNGLQGDLSILSDWCRSNDMSLNVNKCEVISFSRRNAPEIFQYEIGGTLLRRVELVKDLGVLLDSKLTFKQHIDHTVSKAKSTLYLVKQLAKTFDCPYVTKRLYQSLVRPILEYCCVIWSPCFDCDVRRLESVQKQFLLFALRTQHWTHRFVLPPYAARLTLLDLDSLVDRRKLAALSFVHNCLENVTHVPELSNQLYLNVPSRVVRSANVPRLKLPRMATTVFAENGPVRRCISVFNNYGNCYRPGESLEKFKRSVRNAFILERKENLTSIGYL